jgi:hypothetical protein
MEQPKKKELIDTPKHNYQRKLLHDRYHAPNSIDKARTSTRSVMKRAGLTRLDIDMRYGPEAWNNHEKVGFIGDMIRYELLIANCGEMFRKIFSESANPEDIIQKFRSQ